MTRAVLSITCRFAASTRAVAAVEFAMIMPTLLLLFLASFDAANGIAIYMKVRAATYTLAAVTNQYGTGNSAIATADMTAITGATAAVLAPYSSTPTIVTISQIKATSATAATVSWSYSVNGTPLTQGATFTGLPSGMASNTCSSVSSSNPCYLIYAQVSYTYTPTFGAYMTGPITLSDTLYVTPRSTVCIVYNSVPSSC